MRPDHANRIDVFARGKDSTLQRQWLDSGSWGSWESRGGLLTSDPDVVAWGPNRLDVFATAQDHTAPVPVVRQQPRRLGRLGKPRRRLTRLTATSWGPGRLDVHGAGIDSAVHHRNWETGAWSGWNNLGDVAQAPIAATTWTNRVDAFTTVPDSAVHHAQGT
ncbi:hypothetical protein FRZ03_09525 [Streptomyces misionensis]|uniref:PLL-like beta propeller domain-containing protein n=1 Tax=Streptomyces misionensis TaxID=67331 RepID=A0A5C6JXW5_9ACTN|nr:hypothetical protein [Streptomyces misionensis]TWV53584.1 hypothetical protein FRZ03_09525 [Streptomyces misionensis]